MRWIGYFLLVFLGIITLLLFIRIKVEIFVQNQYGWIELRYLWFKYRVNVDDVLSESMKEEGSQQIHEVKKVAEEKATKTEVKEAVKVKVKSKVLTVEQPETKGRKVEKVTLKKKETVKEKKVKRKLDFKEIKQMLHRGKVILKEARTVLLRLTTKIRIQKLDSVVEFSLDDAMTTGCLLGVIWGVQANIYRFIERYVKKIDSYHFDVTSKFSGNSIFLNLSCILSFRIVDIIIVLLLSFKELLTIKQMLKLEEE